MSLQTLSGSRCPLLALAAMPSSFPRIDVIRLEQQTLKKPQAPQRHDTKSFKAWNGADAARKQRVGYGRLNRLP